MYLKPIRFMFMIPTGIVVMEARELHVITDGGIVNRYPFSNGERATVREVVHDAWVKMFGNEPQAENGFPRELYASLIKRLEEITNT